MPPPTVAPRQQTADAENVSRISVKVPPFWPADPDLWFAQLEQQFQVAGISNSDTKFAYVAGNLDQRYASEVRDILLNPPESDKYDALKEQLIRRIAASQEQKTRQLLEREEIGDRKPSQFLRHLQSLAGRDVPDSLLKTLWIGRLPTPIQAILAAQKGEKLDDLAQVADTINEATNPPSVSHIATLQDAVNRLTTQIESLNMQHRRGPNRRISHNRPRSRSNPRRNYCQKNKLCIYHARFGRKAYKCQKPCEFQTQGNEEGSR